METTLFEVKFYNGSKFNVFCNGKSQKTRFFKFIEKNKNEIEYWKDLINGIHTIKQFEQITTKHI